MRLLLLASGNGSLAQSVIDDEYDIAAVLSDNPDAYVLTRAANSKIPSKVIKFKNPREEWDREIYEYVSTIDPDLVVSVGFMRILSGQFVERFKTINSHPSLLPNFPGAHAVRDALAAGSKLTGCTIHWVDAGVDTGPIIAQTEVPIEANDDENSLHERIKIVERKLIVKALEELGARS